jgi:glycosyltransferase involved in cell wall biosynthesis
MNILFLMIAYPDVNKDSSMYTDLAREFSLNGYSVYVAVANGPVKTSLKSEGGVNVLRVKTLKLFNTSIIRKGLANIFLPFQVRKMIGIFFRDLQFDSIIVPTPPITYLSTIKVLKTKYKSKVYLILRDIFPQNAKDLGIIKSSILFNYFRRQEKSLYSISDFIGCMSEGNIAYVKEHNPEVAPGKLHLLPNWKNISVFSHPDINLKKQPGLENKFIALYGGNFGKPQQIDFILELAHEMKHLSDIVFLLVGNGTEKERISELIIKMELKNVMIRDSLPRKQYQELVKVCDIGLVNISNKFSVPNIPSRTLSYWEAKLPILAAIDKNTDYSSILEQSQSGLWSIGGDLSSYKQNFENLFFNKELRVQMGENGYRYLLENCTTSHAFSIINQKLNS